MSAADASAAIGAGKREETLRDLIGLAILVLLAIGTGVGLRDPWPADEPRFALIARDMLASGDWLFPRVGGDLYAEKPPLFFWIVAVFLRATGSLRVAILLPGFLSALGAVFLTYDLARRLWERTAGLAAALALLATVQFVWQARQGQIDATLCFFTTLSLYGLLRHLLLGPSWSWYAVGWAAAGLGVLAKGVGFLPLLVLLPYAYARARGWRMPSIDGGWRWLVGPLAMVVVVTAWLAPMLIAAVRDPQLAGYRDELLFSQTITRYAAPWHHTEPFWYYLVKVIPGFWPPLIALAPWLGPRWRESLRNGDARVFLPLAWAALVVLFFSLTSGKRGVYVLPAVPALALGCSPFLASLVRQRGPRNVLFALACAIALMALAAAGYAVLERSQRAELMAELGLDVVGPLLAIGTLGAASCALLGVRRGAEAYGAVLLCALLVVSSWVNPAMNDTRSGAAFMRTVEQRAPRDKSLGLVAWKAQFLLHGRRPVVHFGYARWRGGLEQEAADAAAWVARDPANRIVLVDDRVYAMCFRQANGVDVGLAHRQRWRLVSGPPDPECVARGHPEAARVYEPPVIRAPASVGRATPTVD